MSDERHDIEINVGGNAERELDQLATSSDKAGRSLDKTQGASSSLTDKMRSLKVGVLAVVAALSGIAIAAAKAVRAFAENEAAQGRLERSLKRVNASLEERQRLEGLIVSNRDRFGSALAEQRDALAKLAEASGSAATAYRDLQLAQDIAAQEGIAVSEAAESIRRARIGEVEELKKYNGFTKESTELLGKLEDESLKAEIAIGRLETAYKGAAEANRGTADDIAALEEQLNDAESAVGSMVTDLGKLAAKLAEAATGADDGTISFATLATSLNDAATAMGKFRVEMDAYLDEVSAPAAAADAFSLFNNPMGFIANEVGMGLFGQSRRDRGRRAAARQAGTDAARTGMGRAAADAAPASFDFGVEDGMILAPDGGGGKDPKPPKEEGMVITEADVQAFERLSEIDAKRLEIAKEEDELRKVKLEGELRILEIKDQQLEAGKEQVEIQIAEVETAREVAAIQQERKDAFVAQQKEELDAVLAKNEAIREQERKTAEERKAYLQEIKEAREAQNQAAIDGIAGAAQAATGFVKNERARAAIRGAMEAAEAIAAGAAGNVAGAIAHGAAAGQFFAIAGGAGSGASGGSSAARSAARGRSISRDSAGIGGQIGPTRGDTSVTLVMQSTWPASPQQSRELTDAVGRELMNRSSFMGSW